MAKTGNCQSGARVAKICCVICFTPSLTHSSCKSMICNGFLWRYMISAECMKFLFFFSDNSLSLWNSLTQHGFFVSVHIRWDHYIRFYSSFVFCLFVFLNSLGEVFPIIYNLHVIYTNKTIFFLFNRWKMTKKVHVRTTRLSTYNSKMNYPNSATWPYHYSTHVLYHSLKQKGITSILHWRDCILYWR